MKKKALGFLLGAGAIGGLVALLASLKEAKAEVPEAPEAKYTYEEYFAKLLAAFGSQRGDPNYDPEVDFNDDGFVTITDYGALLLMFPPTPPPIPPPEPPAPPPPVPIIPNWVTERAWPSWLPQPVPVWRKWFIYRNTTQRGGLGFISTIDQLAAWGWSMSTPGLFTPDGQTSPSAIGKESALFSTGPISSRQAIITAIHPDGFTIAVTHTFYGLDAPVALSYYKSQIPIDRPLIFGFQFASALEGMFYELESKGIADVTHVWVPSDWVPPFTYARMVIYDFDPFAGVIYKYDWSGVEVA